MGCNDRQYPHKSNLEFQETPTMPMRTAIPGRTFHRKAVAMRVIGIVALSVLLGGQAELNIMRPGPFPTPTVKGETKDSKNWVLELQKQIRRCWFVSPSAPVTSRYVRIYFELNRDGTLVKTPAPVPGAPADATLVQTAIRAIEKCQPYSFLPQEEYVGGWDRLDVTFDVKRDR